MGENGVIEKKSIDFYHSDNIDYFDDKFSLKNKKLAETLNISETDAFILGNLTKY